MTNLEFKAIQDAKVALDQVLEAVQLSEELSLAHVATARNAAGSLARIIERYAVPELELDAKT